MKKAIHIKSNLKLMDWAAANKDVPDMIGEAISHERIMLYYKNGRKYEFLAAMTWSDVKKCPTELYPRSFYFDDCSNEPDSFGHWVLLLNDKKHAEVKAIISYGREHWSEIIANIVGTKSINCPHKLYWLCEDDTNDGLSTYSVYLDDVFVGSFID